jgi:3-deoxy-D-manno-octulosonate 8-phosphate phosphatase (KDO 8-P phosphatase)
MESTTDITLSRLVTERAGRIKLLLMDVDGVMTDGRLYYMPAPNGEVVETKGFDSHDGVGLLICQKMGIVTGVITGRESPATTERAKLLNMRYVYQGRLEKVEAFEEILKDAGIRAAQTAYIGDDFTDVPLLRRAGLGVATANARKEVKGAAHYTTKASGGHGAVREVVEMILKSQGVWEKVINKFFKDSAEFSL